MRIKEDKYTKWYEESRDIINNAVEVLGDNELTVLTLKESDTGNAVEYAFHVEDEIESVMKSKSSYKHVIELPKTESFPDLFGDPGYALYFWQFAILKQIIFGYSERIGTEYRYYSNYCTLEEREYVKLIEFLVRNTVHSGEHIDLDIRTYAPELVDHDNFSIIYDLRVIDGFNLSKDFADKLPVQANTIYRDRLIGDEKEIKFRYPSDKYFFADKTVRKLFVAGTKDKIPWYTEDHEDIYLNVIEFQEYDILGDDKRFHTTSMEGRVNLFFESRRSNYGVRYYVEDEHLEDLYIALEDDLKNNDEKEKVERVIRKKHSIESSIKYHEEELKRLRKELDDLK